MKDLRSDEGINQVPGILWPFSTVINPAVNLGQLCPSEEGEQGLLRVPWSLFTWGSLSPDPAMFLSMLAL